MIKKRIRIGFDFDKVFVNYPQFVPDRLINRLYKKKSSVLTYRIPGKMEQRFRIISHHHLFRTPIAYNIKTLKAIKQRGIETYLVSSRFGFLKNKTQTWLQRHQMEQYFDGIYFNFDNQQPHKFKNKVIKSLRITHYVDDDLDLLLYLTKNDPKLTLYWLSSRHLSTKLPKNIVQIKRLQEIPQELFESL